MHFLEQNARAAFLPPLAATLVRPMARAIVAAEPEDGSVPPVAAGLTYLVEVGAAKEAIEVWRMWRPGQMTTLDDKLASVTYYAQNDAWLPIE